MVIEISSEFLGGINGALMRLFETVFGISISAIIISESAFDLGNSISQAYGST